MRTLIFYTLLTMTVLVSCQKSNITTQRWQVQRGIDTATWGHAFFCTNSEYKSVDTIQELFNEIPDSTYYLKGTIRVFSREPYQDSLFIRNYVYFIKQID